MGKSALYVDKNEFLELLSTKIMYRDESNNYLKDAYQKTLISLMEYNEFKNGERTGNRETPTGLTWVFPSYNLLYRMSISSSLGDRDEIETDESKYQIIPYVTFTHGEGTERTYILKYTRGASGGENRLKTKHSIGFGGHIEEAPVDHSVCWLFDCIYRSTIREIEEELNMPMSNSLKKYIRNKLADESNFIIEDSPVGRVHLGLHINIELTEVLSLPYDDHDLANIKDYVNKLIAPTQSMDVEKDIVENVNLCLVTPSILFDYNWETWSMEVIQTQILNNIIF